MSTPDISGAVWVKSSYSGGNEGQCLEYTRGFVTDGVVPVRDSKRPGGPVLMLPAVAWAEFVAALERHP
ncbi:DUF397 domain-containing protein [Streptomyces sp. NPDC046215]